MIKAIKLIILIPFSLVFLVIILGMTLWMNVFTIPFLLLALLFCTLIKCKKPRPHFYGLMLYPTWSNNPATLRGTYRWFSERRKAKKQNTEWWIIWF